MRHRRAMGRAVLWPALALMVLMALAISPPARASGVQQETAQPTTFTSPIDITGATLQIQASAPDRNTGQPVNVTLPVGLIDPALAELTSNPLNVVFDRYWSVKTEPNSGLTQRQKACDKVQATIVDRLAQVPNEVQVSVQGPAGIGVDVPIDLGLSVYDFSCNLAPTGSMYVQQSGSTLTFAYQLFNNSIEFYVSTFATCHRGRGTPFCPNDPGIKLTFALQLVTVVQTPDLCHLGASNGTVYLQGVNPDIEGFPEFLQTFDQYFIGGEYDAMLKDTLLSMQQNVPLPIDAGLAGLRNSDACAGKIPEFGRALSAFNSVQTDIDLRNRLLSLRVTHQGIPTPLIDVPDPSVPLTPQQSGFATQTITTDVPTVVAGQQVTVTGSGFPVGNDASTSLAVNMGHGEYGRPVQLINDRSTICAFGWTEVEWGPAGGTLKVERIPGIDTGTCPALYRPTGLTPRTTYQFRARDCDPITCSPWTPIARATTAQSDPNRGTTALTLDSDTSLGSFSVSNNGTFTTTVTIPSGTSAGTHTIRAASGGREARVDIGVTAPGAVRNATIRVADGSGAPGTCGFLTPGNGDGLQAAGGNITGSDIGGRIYGSGFAPGRVELRLGSATGPVVGTVTARADGTFCSDIPAVPANQVGDKVLVALQNGTVVAQINVKVFPGTRVG